MAATSNIYDKLFEQAVAYESQLLFQLHQYALDRHILPVDEVVLQVKQQLTEVTDVLGFLSPKTTKYRKEEEQ